MDIFFQTAPSGTESGITSFLQSPLGILLITIVAGTVGGIVSHILQRRSQHKAWLLENRIDTFSEFLKILEECTDKASEYIGTAKGEDLRYFPNGLVINLLEKFNPAEAYLRVVRLLLDEKVRKEFENLFVERTKILCHKDLKATSDVREKYKEIDQKIQKILEQHLNYSTF